MESMKPDPSSNRPGKTPDYIPSDYRPEGVDKELKKDMEAMFKDFRDRMTYIKKIYLGTSDPESPFLINSRMKAEVLNEAGSVLLDLLEHTENIKRKFKLILSEDRKHMLTEIGRSCNRILHNDLLNELAGKASSVDKPDEVKVSFDLELVFNDYMKKLWSEVSALEKFKG